MVALIVGLVGIVLVLIQEGRRRSEATAKANLANDLAYKKLELEVKESESNSLRAVIEAKRTEVEGLLNEINACDSPESVSSLAKRLLHDPWN